MRTSPAEESAHGRDDYARLGLGHRLVKALRTPGAASRQRLLQSLQHQRLVCPPREDRLYNVRANRASRRILLM
jgi:hypothetical protein